MSPPFVHPTAIVDEGATLEEDVKVWAFCHVSRGARVGAGTTLGEGVHVGDDVQIGRGVKVQNRVSVYTGVTLEDEVFVGPAAVFTNVSNPRAAVSRRHLYEPTLVRRGATVGAGAVIVCGVTLDRHSFVGAGAVVTHDVEPYALMVGVPARRTAWMSRHGARLVGADGDVLTCPESGLRYAIDGGRCRGVDLDDDAPLPPGLRVGRLPYRG